MDFSKQRNYCASLVKKSKNLYHSNVDEKTLQVIKIFSIKPFFSDKIA